MFPCGYLAKKIRNKPDWLKAPKVTDIYSLSPCISTDFTDFIKFWRHNRYCLFDSPEIILDIAKENDIDLSELQFFYYEVYEREYNGHDNIWNDFQPAPSLATHVTTPSNKHLEGYDVVCCSIDNRPEHSPLSCNGLASEISVNKHCLLVSFEEAEFHINNGDFLNSEPGPYRIFSIYTLPDFLPASNAIKYGEGNYSNNPYTHA